MGLRAEVAGHAAHHYLVHPTLAELKNQVIVFRPVQFVGCRDDDIRAPVDIGFVEFQPVGTRTFKAFAGQLSPAFEHARVVHQFLNGAFEKPLVIMLIVIVRGDEYQHAFCGCHLEDAAKVLHRTILLYVLSESAPAQTVLAQEIVLRVCHYNRCVFVNDERGVDTFHNLFLFLDVYTPFSSGCGVGVPLVFRLCKDRHSTQGGKGPYGWIS